MKDSFYFPHDYHARHDPKLERLRMEIGPIGDGIYWDLVEMLYEQGGFLFLKDIPLIAKTLNTTEELMQKIVKSAELFCVNGDKFYSESLLKRLKHINIKRRKARISGRFGGLAKAKRTPTKCLAIKESKVKESKVKDINIKDQPKSAEPFNKPTQEQKEELAKLHISLKDKINIFAFMARVHKQKGYFPPVEAMLKIGAQAQKTQPANIWGYFVEALKQELPKYFADLNIKEAEDLKTINLKSVLKKQGFII